MRINLSKILGLIAVAGLSTVVQLGASTPADARRVGRGPGVRHVHVHHHNNYNRNRRVARGVAVGVATGVVIGTAARSNTCSNLAYRCNRGDVWACGDYDQRCY